MDTLFLILTALVVFGFGFFWGYEREGRAWTAVVAFLFLQLAAFISAVTEADATTVAWQFSFNIIVFNSAAAGYTLGYPRKRSWWKKTLAANIVAIVLLLSYNIFVLS